MTSDDFRWRRSQSIVAVGYAQVRSLTTRPVALPVAGITTLGALDFSKIAVFRLHYDASSVSPEMA
jgi:hypothetical protein